MYLIGMDQISEMLIEQGFKHWKLVNGKGNNMHLCEVKVK